MTQKLDEIRAQHQEWIASKAQYGPGLQKAIDNQEYLLSLVDRYREAIDQWILNSPINCPGCNPHNVNRCRNCKMRDTLTQPERN